MNIKWKCFLISLRSVHLQTQFSLRGRKRLKIRCCQCRSIFITSSPCCRADRGGFSSRAQTRSSNSNVLFSLFSLPLVLLRLFRENWDFLLGCVGIRCVVLYRISQKGVIELLSNSSSVLTKQLELW